MSRSIVLSNGELCVALDRFGEVRDIYYPHVGLEDHVRGHYVHRLGVWVDGKMSWFEEDPEWAISTSCDEDALASSIVARHDRMQLELIFRDTVCNEKPVFIRRVTVTNRANREREIKLYFGHQFEIYKSHGSDTGYYDPFSRSIIHYKGRRVFSMSATLDGEIFSDYAIGIQNIQGKEGTHRDADDGQLSKNPIEHGPVDSVFGLYGRYTAEQSRTAYYWMCAAQSIPEAHTLNQYVTKKSPELLLRSTTDFWKAWVNAYEWRFHKLTAEHISLFKHSLMYIRAHVDKDGGIIASVDSDMLQHGLGLDTYTYVWPRDAAYIALALDRAGDTNLAKRFFEFSKDVISDEGYFMHKYLPDKSLGSSWHPWILNGRVQLPIQEDETALVIYALREHYRHGRDLEFLERMFTPIVEHAADFMLRYRDPKTKLPKASYDLWEEKRGVNTFTCASVYGALMGAAELAKILGKVHHEARYREAATEIRDGILTHLWDDKAGIFVKLFNNEDGEMVYDRTIDSSSVYGIFAYGVLPPSDPKLARAFDITVRTLSQGITVGGIARYDGDEYYRDPALKVSCPWIVTTLWYAEYLMANARTDADLDRVREIFTWVARYALPSGVLAEQLHPKTGEQLSATPLTWSHASYVSAVLSYLDRLDALGIAKGCNPVP